MAGTVLRTLVFALRTSRRSGAVMHRALRVYTAAARTVLEASQKKWPAIVAEAQVDDRLSPMALERVLARRYTRLLDPVRYPLHSSAREALLADLAAALASYEALCRDYEAREARTIDKIVQAGWSLDPPSDEAQRLLDTLGDRPSWPHVPHVRPRYRAYNQTLEALRTSGLDEEEERVRLAQTLAHGTRPLFFPRADGVARQRNFGLLRSAGTVVTAREGQGRVPRQQRLRYRALLYLLPGGDPRARPLAVPPREAGWEPLVALHPSRGDLHRSKRPSTALLLPLECGRWHEQTVEEAVEKPEMVRAARLVFRPARTMAGGRKVAARFFLAVTFAHQIPEPLIIQTYMGIAMDEEARVGWCVRAMGTGETLASGIEDDLWGVQLHWRERRRAAMGQGKLPPRRHHQQAEQVRHAVHHIANRLLAIAAQHSSQIAITDVRYLRLRRAWVPIDPVTGKRAPRNDAWRDAQAEAAYKRACLVVGELERITGYKGPRLGLRPPLSIGGISPRDCHACSQRSTDPLLCTHCGARLDCVNTAIVTAARVPGVMEKVRAARARRAAARLAPDDHRPPD